METFRRPVVAMGRQNKCSFFGKYTFLSQKVPLHWIGELILTCRIPAGTLDLQVQHKEVEILLADQLLVGLLNLDTENHKSFKSFLRSDVTS